MTIVRLSAAPPERRRVPPGATARVASGFGVSATTDSPPPAVLVSILLRLLSLSGHVNVHLSGAHSS